jgi:hypothetical protein
MLGMADQEYFECTCGAVFQPSAGKYQLVKVPNKSAQIWRDYGHQSLTEGEWKNIAYGGMSDSEQSRMDLQLFLTDVRQGTVVPSFNEGAGQSPVILKKGEEVRFEVTDVTLSEGRSTTTSSGGYAGPTIRIAEGVSFGVGGYRSTSRSHDEITAIDKGTLTLTNRRIVFSGSMRTSDADLANLLSVEVFSDGIAIRISGRANTEYYTGLGRFTLTYHVHGRNNSCSFHSGEMIRYLIEGSLS